MGLQDALFKVHSNNDQFIDIEINTRPVPKGRPRLGRYAVYTPKPTRNFESLLRDIFRLVKGFKEPWTGAIHAEMEFNFKYSGTNKTDGYRTSKPDTENLIKSVLDAGNEILYTDDSLVVSVSATKLWRKSDRIHLRLRLL